MPDTVWQIGKTPDGVWRIQKNADSVLEVDAGISRSGFPLTIAIRTAELDHGRELQNYVVRR
jgi:hypothetical protein